MQLCSPTCFTPGDPGPAGFVEGGPFSPDGEAPSVPVAMGARAEEERPGPSIRPPHGRP
mgnify:CR=1 FL=1